MTKKQNSLFRDSPDHDGGLGVSDLEADGVHGLEAVGDVVEDEVAVLEELVVLVARRLACLFVEHVVVQTIEILVNLLLKHIVE